MLEKIFTHLFCFFIFQSALIAQAFPFAEEKEIADDRLQTGKNTPVIFDRSLKLAELIDIAMSNHPETRLAWWNAKRAAASLGAARSAYYPIIGVDASLTQGRDFKFINGPDVDYTIVGADLTLNMLLYDFGERDASVEAAKMTLLAANWQTDWTLQSVLVRVLENTYSVLQLQEIFQAAIISGHDALKMLDAARQLNEAGINPITDVYTSQAQYSQSMMDVIQQQASLEIEKAKLVSSLGLMAGTEISLEPILHLPESQEIHLMNLIKIAMNQRADLMARHARLAESRAIEKKTRLSYRPKLSLGARGGANHAFHDKANAAQYQIKLNLDIPLFDGFNHIYQNRMAYADTQTSLEEVAKLELDISLEVLRYSQTLQAAQKMLPFAEDNLNNAKQAYEGVLEIYRAGKTGITVVSNALRQSAAARIRYTDVRTKLLVAAANLAYSTGTLSPYMESSCKKSH